MMKRILIPIYVLLLNGCDTINQDNSKITSESHLHIQRKVPNHILDLLQGNWGKSNESNVDFTITNKEIFPLVGVITVPLCESNAQKSIPIKSGRETSLGIASLWDEIINLVPQATSHYG